MILITGGAGFIGSNFVLNWLQQQNEAVLNLDKLTYAGNLENLAALKEDGRHIFVRGDICQRERASGAAADNDCAEIERAGRRRDPRRGALAGQTDRHLRNARLHRAKRERGRRVAGIGRRERGGFPLALRYDRPRR